MGSICRQAENEQNTQQSIVFIKVQVKNMPDKQQLLEKYIYNLKENVDRFEDEFYQQSFNLEILNQNLYQSELVQEILGRQDSSQNNSIEYNYDLATESIKGSSFIVLNEQLQNKNNQNRLRKHSKFYSRNRHNSQNNSPLKSILKIPQSNEKIISHSTERYLYNEIKEKSKKKHRVRFMSSEKNSGSSVERKGQREKVKKKQQISNQKIYEKIKL